MSRERGGAIIEEVAEVWSVPPRDLALESDEVHVWRAAVMPTGVGLDDLRRTLSLSELARAERFSFQRDHDRFIVRRGLLRVILGRYLAMDPSRLQFTYRAGGKPELVPLCRGTHLRFNVSSSAELILYAVTRGREIGVDIEAIRPATALERIPEHFFSSREVAELRALSPDTQATAFFACWTRKEAYLKARGEGLALRLDSFDVSLLPGEPAALLRSRDGAQEVSRWSFQALAPSWNYAAALVVEGHRWRLKCMLWGE